MSSPDDQGGAETREAFQKEIDEAFTAVDEAGTGVLNREGLKNYFIVMN